jgi:LPS O-antigen subunit length determinant protein (WzzB/FepE family)
MSEDKNTIVLADEFNLYYLIKNFWKDKMQIVIIVSIFAIGSIIYSLVVDEIYQVSSVIKPADATEETTLNNTGPIMGFSIGGYTSDPVVNNILITLKSDTFLETIYKKYPNEIKIYGEGFLEIEEASDSKLETDEKKRYLALKSLHNVIKFGINTDHNTINISVKLKDKYFAYNFLNDFLKTLKSYISEQNMTNLEYDIKFYNGLIKKTQDPTIKQMLERKLTAKIEKKFTMSANVFTVTTKPAVPAKRVYPKRSFMVIITTFIGGLLALFFIAIKPPLIKIAKMIRD